MTRRGRLTLPGLVKLVVALFCLGALWPVFYQLLVQSQSRLGTGQQYLFLLLLPVALLVLLAVMWRKAAGGAM